MSHFSEGGAGGAGGAGGNGAPKGGQNPLDIPDMLHPVRADIDWGRRVVRLQQVPDRFAIQPQTVLIPFFALKQLAGTVLQQEAGVEYRGASRLPDGDERGEDGVKIIQ